MVTWGSTVYLALDMARQLEKDGVAAEVIDLRSIVPLDEELILSQRSQDQPRADRARGHAYRGFRSGGRCPHRRKLHRLLDGTVVRVAAKDSFVPSAANLELVVLPAVTDLLRGAQKVLAF